MRLDDLKKLLGQKISKDQMLPFCICGIVIALLVAFGFTIGLKAIASVSTGGLV
jgi:hypothetical protein